MWSGLSDIIGWLSNIVEKISSIPTLVWEAFKGGFDALKSAITNLPTTVYNAFKTGLDAIKSAIDNISEFLGGLPTKVWNSFKNGFISITDWLSDIFDKIKDLPTTIINGIKEIFIPNIEDINSMFNKSVEQIRSKFGFQEIKLDTLANQSTQPTDIEGNYNINGLGNKSYKFFDTKFLIKGVEYFRPFIRGFIILLLAFYNYRQFLGFIGHDVGMVAGATNKKGDE